MKNSHQLSLLVLFLLLIGTGCGKEPFCTKGEGPVVSDTLSLPPIEGVELCISSDVTLRQGPDQLVVVHGQQNLIDKLKLDIRNDVWKIDLEGCIRGREDLDIEITLPDLKKAKITGSGDIEGDGAFTELDYLDLAITGSGNILLDAECTELTAEITGSGNMYLAGLCDRADLEITGSGDFHNFDMPTDDVDIKIAGSGNCEVSVNESLDVTITGSGDVYYKGNPDINVKITGSGRLINEN